MNEGARVNLKTPHYGYTQVYLVKRNLFNWIVRADNGHHFEVNLNEIALDSATGGNPVLNEEQTEPGFKIESHD